VREATESTRLNPRALVAPADTAQATEAAVALRGGLEALEHATLTLRGLTRAVLDSAETASAASPVRDQVTREQLASFLAKLGEAIRTYGRLVQVDPVGDESLEEELAAEFDEANELQEQLAALLKPRLGDGGEPSEWPLRGDLLTHVDRLRSGLSVEAVDTVARVQYAARHKHRARKRAAARANAATRPHSTRRPRSRPREDSRR
jgi:hypothetical protein